MLHVAELNLALNTKHSIFSRQNVIHSLKMKKKKIKKIRKKEKTDNLGFNYLNRQLSVLQVNTKYPEHPLYKKNNLYSYSETLGILVLHESLIQDYFCSLFYLLKDG